MIVQHCIMLYCTEPFIITLPSSQYDLSNVERDVKHQIVITLSNYLGYLMKFSVLLEFSFLSI